MNKVLKNPKSDQNKKINLALIGLGYWGPNYLRVITQNSSTNLLWACDLSPKNLQKAQKACPGVQTTTNYKEILKDSRVDAVVVATSTTTHYKIVRQCLLADKNILVEKPLDIISKRAKELVQLSQSRKKILMVGHIFRFNSAVQKIKQYVDDGVLGRLRYFTFRRTGLGPIRDDINVMWDLAPHDISILLHLVKAKPESVSATGQSYLKKGNEDIVFLTIKFSNKIVADFDLSWIDPIKIRQIIVVGEDKMVLFDDVSIAEKIKLFDKGVSYLDQGDSFGKFQASIRDGDILIPKVSVKEPLQEEFQHFIDCMINKKRPITDGQEGYRVVKILEAAQKSLKTRKMVKINF